MGKVQSPGLSWNMSSGIIDWKGDSLRALARILRSRLGGDGMGSVTGRDKSQVSRGWCPTWNVEKKAYSIAERQVRWLLRTCREDDFLLAFCADKGLKDRRGIRLQIEQSGEFQMCEAKMSR